jgi:uncharacterized HAD superfamily protein
MFFKGSESVTLEYLQSNNIKYTQIIFSCSDKAKVCKNYNIDVMVDDSIKYCEEVKNANINSILFTSSVNKSLLSTVQRVNSWLELEAKINSMV